MKSLSLALGSALALLAAPAFADNHGQHAGHDKMGHSAHGAAEHALHMAVANPNRDGDRARDVHRHPVETLTFFQVAPDMKVGEYAPGGGWYSRLLGNYLGEKGKLVGLFFDVTKGPFGPEAQERTRAAAAKFPADVEGFTGLPAEHFAGYTLDAVPEGEKGSFDRILIIRMMHNISRWNMADSEIKAMRELLKDDGMIGIVQHRAKADAPYSYTDGSKGYLRQADVVAFMEMNGFELVGTSEVNANPMDSADHAEGVWEMPPMLRTKREDLKDKGESDRMTLLFRKRP